MWTYLGKEKEGGQTYVDICLYERKAYDRGCTERGQHFKHGIMEKLRSYSYTGDSRWRDKAGTKKKNNNVGAIFVFLFIAVVVIVEVVVTNMRPLINALPIDD